MSTEPPRSWPRRPVYDGVAGTSDAASVRFVAEAIIYLADVIRDAAMLWRSAAGVGGE